MRHEGSFSSPEARAVKMLLRSLLFVSASLLAVNAQDATSSYTSGTSYAPSSSTSAAFTHTVSVAYVWKTDAEVDRPQTLTTEQAGFTFSPDVTLADVGDVIGA